MGLRGQSERGVLRTSRVVADGDFTRYQGSASNRRGLSGPCLMITVNLGGTAGVMLLSHIWDESFLFAPNKRYLRFAR
ncbi:MAG: hypothetical protein GX099_05205 [Clostridiaceae bacterium]|nr:hypothetical protein [Clostridiaceae bacterium]